MSTPAKTSQKVHADEKISAYGTARSTIKGAPLSSEELRKIDAYWRASLYLSLGMLYLKENPLLREPLKIEQIKPRLLGHWGSDPGQSFTYIHFNRLINKYDLNAIFISGPDTARLPYCRTRTSKARTPKSTRIRAKILPGCSASSSSSASREGLAVMRLPKPLAASTKAESSVTASRTPTGRCMTIQT